MRNAVEVARQVRVIHRRLPFPQMLANGTQGVVRRPPGPKPVGAVFKVRFKDRLQDQQHCRLHHPIPHGRCPDGLGPCHSTGHRAGSDPAL